MIIRAAGPEARQHFIDVLLTYKGNLEIGRSVGWLVEWAAVDIFAAIEKQIPVDIDQVVVDIDPGLGKTKWGEGLALQIL
jgi:hypothetical protein